MREMKDSGVSWIASIPSDWKITKVKFVCESMISGGTPDSSNDSYYVEDGTPWVAIGDMSSVDYVLSTNKRISNEAILSKNLTLLPAGTILYAMYASVGKVSELSVDATINQALLGLTLKNVILKSYFKYNLKAFEKYAFAESNGNTQFNMNAQKVSNICIVYPPMYEQKRIAAFLDNKCSQVDNLISNVQAQIDKLKAYNQSVITEIVTKGLDPSVTMKDSGIEWIRKIPEHWSIERGKCLFRESDRRSIDGSEELLTVSQYTGITPRSQKNVNMFEALSLEGYKICEIGDIAANTMWMWAGAIGVSQYYGVISPSYNVYRPISTVYHTKYLDYLLRTPPLVRCYESQSTGIRASRLRLYPHQFLNIRFPVPPYAEQEAMVTELEKRCEKVDKLIAIKQQKIDKLNEYKKSLIYEYVTGKKEVACD